MTVATHENFDILDLAKFACSIVIVGLHSDLLYDGCPRLNLVLFRALGRLAVPLFFLMSAFFFYRKGEPDGEKVKRYVVRMLVLYFCWFVVHLPKTIFDRFICSGRPPGTTTLVFLKSFFTTSTFSGSWFLCSCVFSVLALFFLNSYLHEGKSKTVMLVTISLLSYLFCVSASAYGKLFYSVEAMERISLFFAKPYTSILVGIPYFAVGKIIAEHQDGIAPHAGRTLLFSWALFFGGLVIAEAFLTVRVFQVAYSTDCYLFLLPCSVVIFLFLLTFDIKIRWAGVLRKYSTIIFFSHFLWLFGAEILEWLAKGRFCTLAKFSFAIIGSLLTSAVLLTLEKRPRMAWLRFFH